MSSTNGNYLESHCCSSKHQSPESDVASGRSSQRDCNGYNKEPCQGPYRKRKSEKVIVQMIFDVFIAPILAACRTILSLSLNLIILFGLAAAFFKGFTEIFLHTIQEEKQAISLANCKF